jgi:4-amino-4-deoxy-L-arabinose transferase-like glycosyltransferase
MLAAGDLLVPRLNGVPYFEKPPLLYWVNAASLRLFGETPWAARLPTRLAGLGTTLLVLIAGRGSGLGLRAAVLFLAAPWFSRERI